MLVTLLFCRDSNMGRDAMTLVLFLQALCPHFICPSNTNSALKPKPGLCCMRDRIQIQWVYSGRLLSVRGGMAACSSSTRSASLSEALSLAEEIWLYKGFWSFVIQHNILINVNMISAVWESAVRQLKVTLQQRTSWLKMYQTATTRWQWKLHRRSSAAKNAPDFKEVAIGQNKDWQWSMWLLLLASTSLRTEREPACCHQPNRPSPVQITERAFVAPPEEEKWP